MDQKLPARKPEWLRVKLNMNPESVNLTRMMRGLSLHTVCEEANCPNRAVCFRKGTATFMILGNHCTRNCTFCNVTKELPCPVDHQEPQHIAAAVRELKLRHVVITSVTRDDLPDGGSNHFADVIRAIKAEYPLGAPTRNEFKGAPERTAGYTCLSGSPVPIPAAGKYPSEEPCR